MLSKLAITILKGTVNPINSKTLQLSATVGQVSIRTPTESQQQICIIQMFIIYFPLNSLSFFTHLDQFFSDFVLTKDSKH